MDGCSVQQHVKIIQLFYQNGCSIRATFCVVRPFNGLCNRPTERTIRSVEDKFEATGLVNKKEQTYDAKTQNYLQRLSPFLDWGTENWGRCQSTWDPRAYNAPRKTNCLVWSLGWPRHWSIFLSEQRWPCDPRQWRALLGNDYQLFLPELNDIDHIDINGMWFRQDSATYRSCHIGHSARAILGIWQR